MEKKKSGVKYIIIFAVVVVIAVSVLFYFAIAKSIEQRSFNEACIFNGFEITPTNYEISTSEDSSNTVTIDMKIKNTNTYEDSLWTLTLFNDIELVYNENNTKYSYTYDDIIDAQGISVDMFESLQPLETIEVSLIFNIPNGLEINNNLSFNISSWGFGGQIICYALQ